MKAWGIEEMQQISQFIGGHARMPSAWVQKGFVPWEVIYTCHLDTGCSLDWLYNGKLPIVENTEDLNKRIQRITRDMLFLSSNRLNIIKETQGNGFNSVANSIAAEITQEFTCTLPKSGR